MNWVQSQSVVLQDFLAGLFTWGCTIVGSAIVFFFKHISRKLLDIMMGFAAGVMIVLLFGPSCNRLLSMRKTPMEVWLGCQRRLVF